MHQLLGLKHAPEIDAPQPLVLEGGIRTVEGYIGRPSLLPYIRTVGRGRLSISAPQGSESAPSIEELDENVARIRSSTPLDGVYRIRLEEEADGSETLAVESRVRFTRDAPEHPDVRSPDFNRWFHVTEAADRAWDRCSSPAAVCL